jgi:acyl carrier protein
MSDLKQQLKEQIIEELNLQGITPDDIDSSAPLFGDGLSLDSIDALELVVIMDNYHGVKMSDESIGKEVLYSIDTMADFILKYQSEN